MDHRPLSRPLLGRLKTKFYDLQRVQQGFFGRIADAADDQTKDGTQAGALRRLDGLQVVIGVEVWKILSCSTILDDGQDAPLRFEGIAQEMPFSLRGGPETSAKSIKRALAPLDLDPHPLSPLSQAASVLATVTPRPRPTIIKFVNLSLRQL